MALRLTVEKLFGFDGLRVHLRANDTLTEAAGLVRHGASAEDLDVALMGRALLIDNMAFLVRVCRCAVVGRVGHLLVELDDIGCGALGHVLSHMFSVESKTRKTELAILSVLFQRCFCTCCVIRLLPAELSATFLRVHLHALSSLAVLVCLRLVPAEVCDRTLIVFSAHSAILEILFADRLKGPYFVLMAVEALDAVGVLVAGATFLVTDADFLTVTTLALAGN